MDQRIQEALHRAYEGEAKAVVRLRVYAKKAEEEGYPQIAKLFRAISISEEIHSERALKLLREISSTEENLKASFESETRIAGVAYEEFLKLAGEVGDKPTSVFFSQARDVEEVHARLYKEAMSHLMEERQTTYYICQVCGYVSDGVLPEECPVCSAPKENFSKF